MARAAAAAFCAVVLAIAPGGCGGDDDDPSLPPAETRLLEALDSMGGGQAFTGTGYG